MFRFFFISIALCFIVSCTPIMRYETGRNPKNKNYCHLHNSKLYTTKADIFFGPYCPIGINKKITPYPNVGICGGCCVGKIKQVSIKVCATCDSIYQNTK